MRSKSGLLIGGWAWQCYARTFLLVFLLALSGSLAAQTRSVMDIRVNYKADKTSLAKVLKDIRALTNVRFTYNSDLIRNQPPVNVDAKGQRLQDVLQHILAGTKLQFAEDMGGIIIYPEVEANQKTGRKSFLLSGQVVSENGPNLEGISIRAMESNIGTVTGDDGIFSLMVYENELLRFSGVGIRAVTMRANPATEGLMKVTLKPSPEEIKEVVVNGYQRIEARMATASTFKLNAADILQPGEPSIDRMLQGKVPGLMILNTSGGVNAAPKIRMRGTSTFIGNASPIWVIDGMIRPEPVPLATGELNNIIGGDFNLLGNAVRGLNPYDIESITFLRDAAATAIYGTQAANGVIVIQTKRGKAGPLQISYNTDMSFSARPSYRRMNLMNSEERMNFSKEIIDDGLVKERFTAGFEPESSYEKLLARLYARELTEDQFKAAVQASSSRNTDWFRELFRNAFSMNHSLSVGGGNENTTWYASLGYGRNNGAGKKDGNERYNADIRLNAKLSKRLKLDLHLMAGYSQMEGYYTAVNPMTYAIQASRFMDPHERYAWSLPDVPSGNYIPKPINYNIHDEIANTLNTNASRNASANLQLSYNIGGGLRFEHMSSAISDATDAFRAAFEASSHSGKIRGWNLGEVVPVEVMNRSELNRGGIANFSNMNSLTINTRNSLQFSKYLFKQRDQFDFTVGTEISSRQLKGHLSQEPGYYHDRGKTFYANDFSRRRQSRNQLMDQLDNRLGLYANAAYNYDNRYTVGVTVRSDGSNRFGQYSNSKFLPNFGSSFRWNVTGEKWMKTTRFFNNLGLRASYGTQGNVVTQVGPSLIANFIPGTEEERNLLGRPPVVIKTLPYPNLRWEKTYQWNLGLDVALLQNRVNLAVDLYGKKSVDLLSARAVPAENGVEETYVNLGNMTNGGLEITLNVVAVQKKDMTVSFTFMNSINRNKVGEQGYRNNHMDYLSGSAIMPGRPLSGFYSFSYNGLDGKTGLPVFNFMNPGKILNEPYEYMVYSGQLEPSVFGNVAPSFRYKNFSMNMALYYSIGASKRLNQMFRRLDAGYGIPSPSSNASRDLIDRWRKPGDEQFTDVPVIRDIFPAGYQQLPMVRDFAGAGSMAQYQMYDLSDLRVVNANFLRCRYIMMAYAVPATVFRNTPVKNLRMSLNISNPFTIASRQLNGQDPEIDGVGTTALPISRQFAWSIQANF
ncbi:SusC/RagA family TonB-linked outer membrane protein [Chitinophaga caseinilytica]|uniref:SusC/RagA family TonB-linked outer membrane protein n=1 Tax=Chitinophaga caseinilytica TaxID=2267521 RepID=UPI003C30912A